MNSGNRDRISQNNDAFKRRLREFHRSTEGRAIREQVEQIRRRLFDAYKELALAHWQENGDDASTGWGCTPEGLYQQPRKREHCAAELADKLVDHLLDNPKRALGAN